MRKELERRPLVLLAAGLIVGLVAFAHLGAWVVPLALAMVLRTWPSRLWLAGGLVAGGFLAPQPVEPVQNRSFVDCRAVVLETARLYPDRQTVPVQAGALRLMLYAPSGIELGRGDVLLVRGVARPPSEASTRFYRNEGLHGRLEPTYLKVIEQGPWPFRLAEEVRRGFLDFTARTLPPAAAAQVDALCFNVDTLIGDDVREDLRRTGTVHIVSASGLHAMVLASTLLFLLSLLPVPRGWQVAGVGLVLAFYACATGLQGPIVRAGIVALAGLSAYLVRRDADPLSALGMAALGFLLWDPTEVFRAGFQLSFVIVAAFALFLPASSGTSVTETLRNWLLASLVATLASTPLIAYHFGQVPLLTIPANALIAFVVPPVVVLSLFAFFVGGWLPSLAQGVMLAVASMTGWIEWSVSRLASPDWSVLAVPAFSGYWLLPVYAAILMLWRQREVKAPD